MTEKTGHLPIVLCGRHPSSLTADELNALTNTLDALPITLTKRELIKEILTLRDQVNTLQAALDIYRVKAAELDRLRAAIDVLVGDLRSKE